MGRLHYRSGWLRWQTVAEICSRDDLASIHHECEHTKRAWGRQAG